MGKAMGAPQEEGLTILHGGTNGPSASLLHPGSFKSRLAGSWVPCFLFLPFSLLPSPLCVSHPLPPSPSGILQHLFHSSSLLLFPSSTQRVPSSLLPSVSTLVFVWDGGCLLVSL